MKIGFIGLGNVGGKLAGSLLRNNFDLTVRDLDENLTNSLKDLGAKVAKSPKELAEQSDLIITSLPSPEVSAEVMESEDGILNGLSEKKIWLEMSTTDENEVKRLGKKVIEKKAIPLDGPVSGGCHRAATGNIAIFVGGERKAFEKILPALTVMGRKILHTGELGTASVLKVITNYLASAHLVALGEAWTVAKKSNLDLAKTYKGIAISSGNSFVHETESQVILNGSYNINFTMDLVLKDTSLFDNLAKKLNAPLEISPQIVEIFKDGQKKYGSRAWSSMIVKRMEDLNNINFPSDIKKLNDEELKVLSEEVRSEMIDAVSKTGGHLGAGLGVVELTVAIHATFDTPHDRLIWDVGHQAYPHKILTGRKNKIHTIRQKEGLAPFPAISESEFDAFGVGHSSTSISAALGMTIGSNDKALAVIGDGALTAGMAVDANVLIFERIREEIKLNKGPARAIELGYEKALSAIIDANITTFITAVILFAIGSGPVRGFSVTLGLGIITSVFTAIFVTRLLIVIWFERRRPRKVEV